MSAYSLWKFVHVLSACVLLGTGAGIAFFCWFGYRRASRSGGMDGLRSVLRLTVLADFFFTAPAVVIQLVSGVVLMQKLGWPWHGVWAITVFTLYAMIGICWLPVVWIQMRLARMAESVPSIAALPGRFHFLFRLWFMLGIPAFAGVIALVYLMVVKPAFLF